MKKISEKQIHLRYLKKRTLIAKWPQIKKSEVFLTNTKTTEPKLEHLLRNLRQTLVYRLKISFEQDKSFS